MLTFSKSSFQNANGLSGSLLVAMPGMPDPRFAGTVTLICFHNDDGAMGIILNRLIGTMKLGSVLEQLNLKLPHYPDVPVHLGGPAAAERGFIIHGAEFTHDDAMPVTDDIAVSATGEVLEKIMLLPEKLPRKLQWLFALGCASWTPGQLDAEIQEGTWLTAPATRELVFTQALPTLWTRALGSLGIDNPAHLSVQTGRA